MGDFLVLMTKPFVTCLVLAGIHTYLGLHVIQRGVIFVDLALAQVAALGATVGFLLGFGLHTTGSYFLSLAFTVASAGIFSLLRSRGDEIPQEAYIGVVYAVAAAASILILSIVPEGGEELKAVLVGHILFVDWGEIIKVLSIYLLVGAVHWRFRDPLLSISHDADRAAAKGMNVKAWDFLFYVTFGVVVTSSVEVAGVLLVFSFLVVPAVCGVLLAGSTSSRLMTGWFCGFVTSVIGIVASYCFDLPTGAMVVCTFGACLLVCLGFHRVRC